MRSGPGAARTALLRPARRYVVPPRSRRPHVLLVEDLLDGAFAEPDALVVGVPRVAGRGEERPLAAAAYLLP